MEIVEKSIIVFSSGMFGLLLFSLMLDLMVFQLHHTISITRKLVKFNKPYKIFKIISVHEVIQGRPYCEVLVDDGEGVTVPISVSYKVTSKIKALLYANSSDTEIYIIGKLNYKTLILYSFKEFRFKKGEG